MRLSLLGGGLAAVVLLCPAATSEAKEWFWLADNHTSTDPTHHTSLWTDNVHTFTTITVGDNWNAYWDSPSPGRMTIKGGYPTHSGGNGRYLMAANFSSGNNPAQPADYWDAYKGITVGARINIPAVDGASGNGSLLLGMKNPSTQGLQGGKNFFCAYLGWDENGTIPGGVGINFWTPSGGAFRGLITPSVNVIGVETIWTLSAKRVVDAVNGDTIVWDLWINGVPQGDDQLGPDGDYHALVGFKDSDQGTSIYIGERRSQPFNHETQWDYLAVTNAGVIPAWDPELPQPLCDSRVSPQDPQTSLAIRGRAAEPSAIVYTLQNTGSEDGLTYTVAETNAAGDTPVEYSWLQLDKTEGGPLDSNATETVTASIIDTNLDAGVHTAYVTFTDSCGSPHKHVRRIDLTVIGCRMQLDPEGDVYRTVATAKDQVDPVVYTVTNTGGGSFSYTVGKMAECLWLMLDTTEGGPLDYLESDHVTAAIDRTGLAEGLHSCQLKFTPTCDSSPQASVQYRTVHLSVRDASSTTQWFNAEFWDVQGTDELIVSPLQECPSLAIASNFAFVQTPNTKLPPGIDFFTQGTIDGEPTTFKALADCGNDWARAWVWAGIPLNASYDPAKGMAIVWRMRTGEYTGPGRGPFRVYVPGPIAGSPVAVYFNVNNGNLVRVQPNGGGVLPGVDSITLDKKISDPLSDPNNPDSPRIPTYHLWSASYCYDAGFDSSYAYFNLWIELLDDNNQPYMKKMMFTGANGSVPGPGGGTYSFRANNNDGAGDPGLHIGEVDNSGGVHLWDFEFDYVRVVTLDAAGCPFWNGKGGCEVQWPWPDADEDLDVDQEDFSAFQSCYTGDGGGVAAPSCRRFDRDRDNDVDVRDYTAFEDCTTGPGIPLDPENLPPYCAL